MKSQVKAIQVVIDEQSVVTTLAMKTIIENISPYCRFHSGMEDMSRVVREVGELSAELLITDLAFDSDTNHSQILQLYQLCQREPQLRVVIYSHPLRGAVVSMLTQLTQVSFVSRCSSLNEFKLAIAAIISGDKYANSEMKTQEKTEVDKTDEKLRLLTHCEKDVLAHLLHGKTLSDISSLYSRSIKTISTHKCNAMRKLEAKNVADLFLIKNEFFNALNLRHIV